MSETLIKRLMQLGDNQSDKLAVAFKKDQLTYGDVVDRMQAIGTRLRELGVERGDRVLVTAVSKPEMVVAYLGIQYCGAVAVFIDKNSTPKNAADIYEEVDAACFLTDNQMKGYENKLTVYSLKEIYQQGKGEVIAYEQPDETDISELLFTTGTTGKPKGVVLTYKSVYHILKNTIEGIGIKEEERILLPLPLNHSVALRVLRAALYHGATIVLQNGFAFAKEVENNQTMFDCTAMVAVPASMEILRGQMQDKFIEVMRKFRYIEIGAGSLTIEQRKRLTSQLPDTIIYNTWGSSETGGALFTNVTEIVKNSKQIGTIGKPLPNIEVQVLDKEGNRIKSDAEHPGRMALKGDMQMAGYWKNEELNKETFKDGWLLTSDMVYTDSEGYVYMLGRADDIINVGGKKVSPIEVENIAGEYEQIKECACIGVSDPNEILGQVPVLFVVAKGTGFTEAGIQSFLSSEMERYKLPQHYVLIPELPRNRMGKIDRKALLETWKNQGENKLINPVVQAILTRRSIRKFKPDLIPEKILDIILQAGYHAPTGHNMQTWRFTVIQDKEKIANLKDTIAPVAKENKVHFYGFEEPPCLVLISNDTRNPNGCQDSSCAAENIFLAAHSYGIGSVWLNPLRTLCDEPQIRALLDSYGIPKEHVVWCMAALGYPIAEGVQLAKKKDVVFYVK